jgi:hypothetical protein
MPGLDPGIQVLLHSYAHDVDGRDEPGHDEEKRLVAPMLRQRQPERL